MSGLIKGITGVVMAGGKSSRMGSDKGLVEFDGKPLVQYAIDSLKSVCDNVLISTRNPAYSQFGLPLIADEIPDCGPIGGIYSALKASTTDQILVLACDMPFVTSETLLKLLAQNNCFECIVPRVAGKLEPLCSIYLKSLLCVIERNIRNGNFALNQLIMESNYCLIDFDEIVADFKNFNTLDDIKR